MRLGVCTKFENLDLAAKAGFDYAECNLSALAALDEEAMRALIARDFPIPVLRANGMVPGEVKICGPDASETRWCEYLTHAFSRAHALGVEIAVFGSGAARMVPNGFPFAEAWRQIVQFLRVAAEIGEAYAMRIAIEPLRREECNIVNLVSEGTLLSAIVDSPRVGVLGDTFHMLSMHEPYEALENAGEKLLHVHISRPLKNLVGREYPYPNDGADYESLFAALKQMQYAGTVSIEAGTCDFAYDAPRAVERLKPLMG